jgi:hypothetical protein
MVYTLNYGSISQVDSCKILKNPFEALGYFRTLSNSKISYCIEINASVDNTPTLLVSGGIHGNEISGVHAMIRFNEAIQQGELKLLRGRVILLLGNPNAFADHTRFISSNLNREFKPDEAFSKGVEGFRAYEIREFLKEIGELSLALDLHTVSLGDEEMLLYQNNAFYEVGLKLSPIPLHFLPFTHLMPGALIEEVVRHNPNCPSFVIECGNHYGKNAPEVAYQHIINSLSHLEMIKIDKNFHGAKELLIYSLEESIKPAANFKFTYPGLKTGTFLSAGTEYATSILGSHITSRDLYAFMVAAQPRVEDFDVGFFCSLEKRVITST